MAKVRPFRAVRPTPELAEKVAALPYDVMSSAEARQMAAGTPIPSSMSIRRRSTCPRIPISMLISSTRLRPTACIR